MVVPLIVGGAAAALMSFFFIQSVATLAHWISIGSALLVGIGIFYLSIKNSYFEPYFDSDFAEYIGIGMIASVTSFIGYRLFEALFAILGWGIALLSVTLVILSLVFSPALVARVISGFIQVLVEVVDE